jgi:hypothetical protein
MLSLCIVVVTIASSLRVNSASGQEQQRPRDRERAAVVLRTYEVGDLVVHVPDYELPADSALASIQGGGASRGGGMGGMSGGAFGMGGGGFGGERFGGGAPGYAPSGPYGPPPVTVDSLLSAIVSVVAPETWAQAQARHGGEMGRGGYGGEGGRPSGEAVEMIGEGRIEVVGTALVVSQTEEAHEVIGELLDQLRQGSATRRTVSIDARWLLLDSGDLDRLVKTADDGDRRVDRKALDEFTRRPTSLRGATKCFSGQAVYVISGTQRSFVSSYIPVVGSVELPQPEVLYAMNRSQRADVTFIESGGEGMGGFGGRSVGYQPIITTPNFGATLEVRPTLLASGKEAAVDLQSTVTFPSPEQPAMDPAAMPGVPPVDRVAIQMQKLATTLRVPLGEPLLVGGMTYLTPTPGQTSQPQPQNPPADDVEQRQLYLVIELR